MNNNTDEEHFYRKETNENDKSYYKSREKKTVFLTDVVFFLFKGWRLQACNLKATKTSMRTVKMFEIKFSNRR